MDNQHKHIKGYRDLSQDEITLINKLKDFEEGQKLCLQKVEECPVAPEDAAAKGRWLALARTHLETGFMYAIKAIAQPTNGLGRK